MNAAAIVFFTAVFTAGFITLSYFGEALRESVNILLMSAVAAYGTFLYLDVKSTLSYGRDVVGRRETSPAFRLVTRRWGFAASIPIQAFIETVLAVLAVPLFLTTSLDGVVTAFMFAIFAACHCLGWSHNNGADWQRSISGAFHSLHTYSAGVVRVCAGRWRAF